MYDDGPVEGDYGPEFEQRRAELSNFCEVRVDGYGKLSVEEEYLAQVVTCEHGGAPLETLKAQAIAARGYAKYVTDVERRPLSPTTRDQAYNCGRPPSALARRAVRETSGMVLTHHGKLIMPFYVAGSTRVNANSCKASGGAATQKYVTYNQGRTGSRVQGSSLGWIGNPANRGAMSQNGSACLAKKGWKAERILRFFYGDDIRVTKLSGSCVRADTDPALGNGGGSSAPGSDASNTCDDTSKSSRPNIISRSAWGARAPRMNRSKHTPNRFTIHHTVTSNNSSIGASGVRYVQNIHMNDNGWSDIGYHYVIDRKGRIYAGNPVNRVGAHVGGHNTGNIGIAFLGQYHPSYRPIPAAQPTSAQLKSAGKLIRYLADKYHITPSASKVKGHRDQGSTACPGSNLYAKIGTIIGYAKNGSGPSSCTSPNPGNAPSPSEFKYVRVRAVSDQPAGHNDTIAGFELDSVFGQSADGSKNYFANSARATGSVTNVGAVTGKPDNNSCGNRTGTVAGIKSGGAVIATLSKPLKPGDRVRVVQANYHTGMNDCSPSGTAEIAVSADGSNWIVLSREVSGNATLKIKSSTLRFTKPTAGSKNGRRLNFAVTASSDITRVEYLADDWSLGSTRQGPDFTHRYDFQYTGNRRLEARGYNSAGKLVATDRITVKVQDGSSVEILKPREGSRNNRDITFNARASKDVVRVDYLADGWKMGGSSRSPKFAFSYKFDYTGVRKIEARGYNAAGKMVAVDRITITVKDRSFVTFTKPGKGSTQGRALKFAVKTSDDVVEVEYFADNWSLGSSKNTSTFPHSYKIQYPGVRHLEARAYNRQGKTVAVDRITITVKDSSPPTNSAMARKLGQEAGTCSGIGNGKGGPRCNGGRGGWSTGSCWAYVKAAMIRAGLASRADIARLASRVGMTNYDVQVSAAGFKRAADRASASVLRQTMGLKKVNISVSRAPRGAVIAWAPGCRGAHSRYGHIEVAQGDGYACSDYCGRLRAHASCASVYVPVD